MSIRKILNLGNGEKIKMSEVIDLFSSSGNNVEYGNDISEITYFTCIKTLSESVGKIPIYLLDGDKRRIKDHETNKVFQISTNGYQTPAQFFISMEYARNHYGNGYAYIKRNNLGELESLIPLDSRRVQVWIDNREDFTKRKYYYLYTDSRSGKSYYLNNEDVLHFRSWICEENGIVGRSIREILARSLLGAKASSKFLNELYNHGLIANLAIHYTGDLNDKAQEALLKRVERQARQDDRRMITLPQGFDIQPLDLKLSDAQFLELKKFTALQISAAFGVKPNFLNDFEKSSYANSVIQNLTYYVDTLLPIITQYEQELNRKLLTQYELENGIHYKFNIGVLLRNDPAQQAEIIQKLIQSGVYSINEARNLLDREPCDNGEVHLVNGSYLSIEDLGMAYRKNETGGDTIAESKESN